MSLIISWSDIKSKSFCLPGIHIYSPIYAATEGLIAINLWPERKESYYTLLPRAMFYEFIPIADSEEDQPATLLMHQVMNALVEQTKHPVLCEFPRISL